MNGITILIWITIAIIGIIAIILVKLHYKGNELENDERSIIPSGESINEMLNAGRNKISTQRQYGSSPNYNNNPKSLNPRNSVQTDYDVYIVPETEANSIHNFEYENPNQVLVNYGNTVEKFQEPIKETQIDIMTQNNKDKTELKDLFTIDELIKESKRKDSEREKEAQKISSEKEDLTDIKESIEKQKENKADEQLIEEIVEQEIKEGTISDLINDVDEDSATKQSSLDLEASTTSQKEIEEAISTASQESEEKAIESISEREDITEALLSADDDSQDIPNEEIKQPTLKTPHKVTSSIDDLTEDTDMDLDYRKDLDKFTNKIMGSKIFQEVKDKLTPETEEITPQEDSENYIRNVNEYDPYEPIINETHVDIDASYEDLHEMSFDERLRQENTRRVFNMAKNAPEPELAQAKDSFIKDKPARDNIKINLNNNEVVLKKGDEIIFNHLGETYSSQVYAINGDDISVKYRRQNIKIKPSDVKKIY